MFVTHISFYDSFGGAAIAAYRLHRGLCRIRIDSRMVVAEKRNPDETVEVAPHGQKISERMRRRIRTEVISRDFLRYRITRPTHLDYFSDDRTGEPNLLPDFLPKADIYNLHWVAGLLDYGTFFQRLTRRTPLVWTLHDMNPFTGGCHYASGCGRFVTGCGACPALGSSDSRDLSAAIFRRKRLAYASLDPETVRIITPSAWLCREASRSALFGKFDIATIPYGLDTAIFKPRSRVVAREVFGIPHDLQVVMFAAHSLQNHRKGLDLLLAALADGKVGRNIALMSVGGSQPGTLPGRCYALGEVNNERLMSFAYSAADLFVLPTREDNLPSVALEASACGTPVVAFDVGGLPDLIRPNITGVLVQPEHVCGLRSAITAILSDDEWRARMSAECRRMAVEQYSLEIQADRYHRLYQELLAKATATQSRSGRVSRV